ncbi:MAG: DUF882 domain-containing protein [Deltaproteobacteria bacterium]|nr:DUF882 domain-containing protein [Deltaproteobacteria bacterium]
MGNGRWRQAALIFSTVLVATLFAFPPPALGDGDDDDEQEGESRTGHVHGPDDCEEGTADADYKARLREWREPRSLRRHRWVHGFREVTFRDIHTNRSEKLVLFDDDGEVTDEAAEKARYIWNDSGSGDGHAIRDRLLKILYFVAVKFDAKEIVIISGWRDDRGESATSPHWQGRAADIIVPGAANQRVVDYVREYGKVGVGSYPVAGFVHVDVRNSSFFWRDVSGPGQPSCYYEVDRDLARQYDEEYDEDHDDPRRLSGYHDWQEQQTKRHRE